MKRLSICTSLSGVRPMMTRPIRSGISWTVRPSVATSSRATAVPGSAPAAPGASAVLDPLELPHGTDDIGARDGAAVGGVGRHHGRVAQRVDEARHAAAVTVHLRVRIGREDLAVAGPGDV